MGRRAWNLKRVKQYLNAGGLKLPALPPKLAQSLRDITPKNMQDCCWVLGTRPVRLPPWRMEAFVREAEAGVIADYALLSHGPMTIHRFHYFLVRGGLRLFLQLDWEPSLFRIDSTRVRPAARCIALANDLVKAAAKAEEEEILGPHEALTVVASEVHGSWWRRPGDPRPESWHGDRTGTPQSVLEEVLAWLKSNRRESDRDRAGTPSGSRPAASRYALCSLRPIRWIEVTNLESLGPGMAFDHLYVKDTPIAFIEAWALRKGGSTSLPIRILKLIDSNPVRIRTNWSSTAEEPWRGSAEVLAQEHPSKWAKVVEDIKRAVREYLDRGGTWLLAKEMVQVRRTSGDPREDSN